MIILADDDTQQISLRTLSRWKRVAFWGLGSVAAGTIPLCAIPGVKLFVQRELPTWTQVCERGDFFIVAAAIVIAASVELLAALSGPELRPDARRSMAYLLTGALFLLVGMVGIYVLVLSGVEQGRPFVNESVKQITQAIVNWTSPLALVVAAVYGIFAAYLSGGE